MREFWTHFTSNTMTTIMLMCDTRLLICIFCNKNNINTAITRETRHNCKLLVMDFSMIRLNQNFDFKIQFIHLLAIHNLAIHLNFKEFQCQ